MRHKAQGIRHGERKKGPQTRPTRLSESDGGQVTQITRVTEIDSPKNGPLSELDITLDRIYPIHTFMRSQ